MMANPSNFLKSMVNYDKDKLQKKTLIKVKKFTDQDSFAPEKAKKISKSLACICEWVLALVEYSEQMNMVKDMSAQFE